MALTAREKRLLVTAAALLWMGSIMGATPSHAAVYCAKKVKGNKTKPQMPVMLREGECKRNETDVTAGVVAQFIIQGPQGQQGELGEQGAQGAQGELGKSCTVEDNGDGTVTISCGGGMADLTDPAYVPSAYDAADPVQGATAYGKWWVTQAGGPGTLAAAGVTVGSEYTRCKTCHAWDGLGNKASYANRTGQSTGTASRPDVTTVDLWTSIRTASPTELFDRIKRVGGRPINTRGNGHPDYSTVMSDAQIWNLVKFMREKFIYSDDLYYVAVNGPVVHKVGDTVVSPTVRFFGIGADGNAARGHAIWAAGCAGAACHGADGTARLMDGLTAGQFMRDKPMEVWHKLYGGEITDDSFPDMVPATMTDLQDFRDVYRALTDSTIYP